MGGPGESSEGGKHGENGVLGEFGQDFHESIFFCFLLDFDFGGVGAIHFCGEINISGGNGGSNNCFDYNVNIGFQMCLLESE